MTKSELVSQHFYHWAELKHIVPHTVQDQLQKHICNTDMLRGAEEIGIEDPLRQPGRRNLAVNSRESGPSRENNPNDLKFYIIYCRPYLYALCSHLSFI